MIWNLLLIAAGAGGAYLLKRDIERTSLHARLQARLALAAQILGVDAPPLFSTTAVDAAASDGWRVLYNPTFFEALERRLCVDAGECVVAVELGIMAHELTHHVHGDAAWQPSFAMEQRADQVAGRVLSAVGVDPRIASQVFTELAPACSRTHGCASDRVAAVWVGYSSLRLGRTG